MLKDKYHWDHKWFQEHFYGMTSEHLLVHRKHLVMPVGHSSILVVAWILWKYF